MALSPKFGFVVVAVILVVVLSVVLVRLKKPSNRLEDWQEELTFPPVIQSNDGKLDVYLTHEYANYTGIAHSMTNARLLNGTLPGPTIRLRAGDTFRVFFHNKMDGDANPRNTIENTFRYPDHTNLHFHGGHVSGNLPSDDTRIKIAPGESYQYETHFPKEHMPGTHWIHPHVHGSSALHVSNGAAMAMIVDDPPDYLPEQLSTVKEVLFVVHDFRLERTQNIAIASGDTTTFQVGPGTIFNDLLEFRTVNGQFKPYLNMTSNVWQRWRVIYAGHSSLPLDIRAKSSSCEMVLLAKDGIYIRDFPRPITLAAIPAGGRADLMVRCRKEGNYDITSFSGDRKDMLMTLVVKDESNSKDNKDISPLSSADLEPWTPVYPTYLENLMLIDPNPTCNCHAIFDDKCGPGDNFGCVNDIPFNSDKYTHSIGHGSVVRRLTNANRKHPYHQHVYPYQFIGYVNDNQPSSSISKEVKEYFKEGDWHDVIMMDELEDGQLELRFRPRNHLGVVMLHCHQLTHEDKGMMAWETIVNASDNGGEGCVCDANVN